MSRYPSSGAERFDQQFAESESERNERLRGKRAPPMMSGLDRLHEKENEIARLMAENIRLRDLVRSAYSEGFTEGRRDYSSFHGGKMWTESKTYLALSSHELGGENG